MSLSAEPSPAAPTEAPPPRPAAARTDDLPVIEIYPRRGWQMIPVRELWAFRDLLWLMALRDVTVRYKQTILGALWAIIQPLMQVVVITVIFGKLLGLERRMPQVGGHAVPYLVFLLSGQVLWNCFSSSVNAASGSLIANANMLRKIYFPRLLMPLSSVGAPTVDCGIAALLLLSAMVYYRLLGGEAGQTIVFSPLLVLVPVFIFSALLAALGVGVLLAALSVTYRDFKYVVPFMIQIWFFVTPVIYPVKKVLPEKWEWLLYLNPVAGPIEAFRGIVLGLPIGFGGWAISTAVSLVVLLVGVSYFGRVEREFADVA